MSHTAATLPAGHRSEPEHLDETCVLTIYPDHPLTVDRVLRRLELLRRRLSARWCGLEGAFAGYDQLQVGDHEGIFDGTVHLHARLIRADHSSHVVELTATRPVDPAATLDGQAVGEAILVHGVGRALETRSASTSERRAR
ncbi:hypothetical protein EKO23_04385 [Nocardioides guangzhouensis]|uniref:Uncharacterized protein n=1 Tax=Nocardioides guangzhouensis TaxID=2497878 RepID=A0A4Q4ZJR6_9ACTN|nr:hypothetical protein [Nocardioides guangzhouensis]RYP88085.1 hypothetical protein EKO23_04385 [Nocardioides guangzhouensis]